MRRVKLEPDGVGPSTDLAEQDTEAQLGAIVPRARLLGATAVVVEAEPAPEDFAAAVETAGFDPTRITLQLRRPLPVEPAARGRAPAIVTRAFAPGRDDAAWLDVNNRAFAWHPDQSGQTLDDLHRHEAEPWFRTDGFLVHDSDEGRLDAFCWTKIHARHDPPLGEIYVIGVDPAAHGHGLGRALALAGLDWLHEQGLDHAMLYVEADNEPALGLYASMGFSEHHSHRWWRRTL